MKNKDNINTNKVLILIALCMVGIVFVIIHTNRQHPNSDELLIKPQSQLTVISKHHIYDITWRAPDNSVVITTFTNDFNSGGIRFMDDGIVIRETIGNRIVITDAIYGTLRVQYKGEYLNYKTK